MLNVNNGCSKVKYWLKNDFKTGHFHFPREANVMGGCTAVLPNTRTRASKYGMVNNNAHVTGKTSIKQWQPIKWKIAVWKTACFFQMQNVTNSMKYKPRGVTHSYNSTDLELKFTKVMLIALAAPPTRNTCLFWICFPFFWTRSRHTRDLKVLHVADIKFLF